MKSSRKKPQARLVVLHMFRTEVRLRFPMGAAQKSHRMTLRGARPVRAALLDSICEY